MAEIVVTNGLPAGATWEFHDGPDFYTYSAKIEENSLGIYFGRNHDFRKKKENEEATILPFSTYEAEWVHRKTRDGFILWEALIQFSDKPEYKGFVIHTWIFSKTQESALSLAKGLKEIELKQITNEEKMKVNQAVDTTRVSARRNSNTRDTLNPNPTSEL